MHLTLTCVKLYYALSFIGLRIKLCCIVHWATLHYKLCYTTLRPMLHHVALRTLLHYITFKFYYVTLCSISTMLWALLHCIVLRYKLYCIVNSTMTLLHSIRLWLCYVALWTLLCCFVTNFVTLCVAFCCELYYVSSSINLSSNNMHTQKK